MLTLTSEQRTMLKAHLRVELKARGIDVSGLSNLTKDALIARAKSIGLDVESIIKLMPPSLPPSLANPAVALPDTGEPLVSVTLSSDAQTEYDRLQAAWDELSPKAFRDSLRDLVIRAHKPAVVIEVPAPIAHAPAITAPAIAPAITTPAITAPAAPIHHAKREGSVTLGKLFDLPAGHKSHAVPISLWIDSDNVPDIALDHVWPEDIGSFATTALVRNRPVYVFGPKGVGKTTMVQQVAARLGRACIVISCSEETELPVLTGTLVPSNGGVAFKYGALTKAMQVPGAIVLLDEIDTLREGAAIGLNGILENREYLIPETGERIVCADGVLFVGAGNTNGRGDTSGRYAGTREMNAALMSRFRSAVAVNYLKPAAEAKLLASRASCPLALAKRLIGAANVTRQAVQGGELGDGMSFRALQSWAEHLMDGHAPEVAARCAFLNVASVEESEKLRQIIITHAAENLLLEDMGQQTLGRGANDFSNVEG